jgi:hypothetical protein
MHQIIPLTNKPRFLTTVVPSSNTVLNADEMSRFAEIWRGRAARITSSDERLLR